MVIEDAAVGEWALGLVLAIFGAFALGFFFGVWGVLSND